MTASQIAALRFIARNPFCIGKQLAHEIGLTDGGAYSVVQRLKLEGLIARPMGHKKFALTDAGVRMLAGNA